MGKHLWSLTLIVAALTAGCATKPAPVAGPGPLPLHAFARKWAADLGQQNGPVRQVFVRDELVFAYTDDGTSFVVSRASGTLLHSEKMPGGLINLHPPVLFKDTIVYPTLTALLVYDRKTGKYNRTITLPLAIRSGAAGSRSNLFVGTDSTGGGRVVCLDLSRQYVPIRWGLMFPHASVSAAPAFYNDTVFAAGEDGQLAAVQADTREPIWEIGFFKMSGPVYADVQADESGVYVGSADSKLYCLNRNTGKVKWQYFAGTPLMAAPVVSKDLVMQYVEGSGLVALDKLGPPNDIKSPQFNRQPRWIASDAANFLAEDESSVYVSLRDGHIAALNKKTGERDFVSQRNDFIAFGGNLKDGVIFAATSGNRLLAVQTVTKAGTVGEQVRAAPEPRALQVAAR